jgi:hypothetical protein
VAAGVRVLELANDPAFEKTFLAAMAFPGGDYRAF